MFLNDMKQRVKQMNKVQIRENLSRERKDMIELYNKAMNDIHDHSDIVYYNTDFMAIHDGAKVYIDELENRGLSKADRKRIDAYQNSRFRVDRLFRDMDNKFWELENIA